MEHAVISIVPVLEPPPKEANIVLFACPRNYIAAYNSARMLAAASKYAREYQVYLLPERFAVEDYLCLCLIGPDGVPAGVQSACHTNLDYRGSFRRATALDLIDTPLGKIALLVDVDINQPQVCRQAVDLGAELLISSQFLHPHDLSAERASAGARNAALSNGVAVAAAVSGGGVVIGGDGKTLVPYTEDLPATTAVIPSQWRVDHTGLAIGKQLLQNHSFLFTDEALRKEARP